MNKKVDEIKVIILKVDNVVVDAYMRPLHLSETKVSLFKAVASYCTPYKKVY